MLWLCHPLHPEPCRPETRAARTCPDLPADQRLETSAWRQAQLLDPWPPSPILVFLYHLLFLAFHLPPLVRSDVVACRSANPPDHLSRASYC